MKGFFYLFLICFALFSCSEETPSIEDQLYRETIAVYNKEGIDLESVLDQIENQMISEDVLTGKGGLAKVKFYEKIVETGRFPNLKSVEFLKTLGDLQFTINLINKAKEKVKDKDSIAYKNSDYYTKMMKAQESVVEGGTVSVVPVTKAILAELSTADFEHPFYRMYMLLTCAMLMDKETAYTREIPKRIESNRFIETPESGRIDIRLEEQDAITCNGTSCDINQLESRYATLHDQIGAKAVVHLYVGRTSSYGTFARIQGIFEEYAVRTRNKEAKRSFGKPYAMLTKAQKKQVNDAHPINLVEHKLE